MKTVEKMGLTHVFYHYFLGSYHNLKTTGTFDLGVCRPEATPRPVTAVSWCKPTIK